MTTPNTRGRWLVSKTLRRSVRCPNPRGCGYMAFEWHNAAMKRADGVCTKCGHAWCTPLSDEDNAAALRAGDAQGLHDR